MPRDHARMRLDIWLDEDYTNLTSSEQWLYERLLTHADLSYCGVAEWRPGKLATSAADLTATDIEIFAAGLELKSFLVIDRETEEVLVRSFVKHDKLMDKWNLASAVCRTFTAVASKPLRGVIVHELVRLKKDQPELRGWSRDDVKKVLRRVAVDPSEARQLVQPNPEVCPSDWVAESPNESPNERGFPTPSESPSDWVSPTPYSPLPTPLSRSESQSPHHSYSPGDSDSEADDATEPDRGKGRATA